MADFSILPPLAGGALIGLAAVLLMAVEGRIAGISGLVARLLPPRAGEAAGPAGFVLGLLLAPLAWWLAGGALPTAALP
ncbi:YeeE/YedE family protein, partial [Roseomonas sp. GC11]|nr:YeeE/YedE family protein [Roseomonas sp. GC11]